MQPLCYDETTTSDDETITNDSGKFDKLDDAEFIHDGVLLVGFTKTWEDKEKAEKDYEEFFCKKLIEFYVENGVSLDWGLVDGITEAAADATDAADVTDATEVVEETTEETTEEATEDDASVSNSTMVVFDDASNNDSTESAEVQEEEDLTTAEIIDPASVDWAAIAAFAAESSATSTSEVAVTPDEEEESTITNTASEINAADTSFVQSNTINEQQQPSAGSLNKIPSGGWIGIGLGVFLLAFLIAAVIVARTRRRRRRLNDSGDRQANNNNNDDDNSIWSDEENNNMMQGAGGSALSSVSAIGMASTVVTRLTTGDTEVTLMKKQPWTEREPVV
jgi:hypothetical protein